MGKQKNFGFGGGDDGDNVIGFGKAIPKCHAVNHKAIKLSNGYIFGGSCHEPRAGFDVYIALDYGTRALKSANPWNKNPKVMAAFPIDDMGVPADKTDFKAMVAWVCNQLQAGKKIHIGCYGGHGRTGMVMAAIYAHLTGDKDAIQWVRKNHCERSVESTAQVDFLKYEFGVSHATGYMSSLPKSSGSSKKMGFEPMSADGGTINWSSSGSSSRGGTVVPLANSRKTIWSY